MTDFRTQQDREYSVQWNPRSRCRHYHHTARALSRKSSGPRTGSGCHNEGLDAESDSSRGEVSESSPITGHGSGETFGSRRRRAED